MAGPTFTHALDALRSEWCLLREAEEARDRVEVYRQAIRAMEAAGRAVRLATADDIANGALTVLRSYKDGIVAATVRADGWPS
jgi:hypothetical protein